MRELKCSSARDTESLCSEKSRSLKNESLDVVNYGSEIELFINVVQHSRQRRSQKLCHAVGPVGLTGRFQILD